MDSNSDLCTFYEYLLGCCSYSKVSVPQNYNSVVSTYMIACTVLLLFGLALTCQYLQLYLLACTVLQLSGSTQVLRVHPQSETATGCEKRVNLFVFYIVTRYIYFNYFNSESITKCSVVLQEKKYPLLYLFVIQL